MGQAPRFGADAKSIQVNIDPTEIGRNRPVDVGIAGDAKAVLRQMLDLVDGKFEPTKETAWVAALREQDLKGQARLEPLMHSDEVPIHPLRLCKEVKDFLDRDAILVVDGQGYSIRPPVHSDVPPGSPAQFRFLRHHGSRRALRRWRQGGTAGQAGHGAARRWFVGMNAMEMDTAVRTTSPSSR